MPRQTAAGLGAVTPHTDRRRSLGRGVARMVRGWRRRRAHRRAFERAYLEFRATHTHCHELCFDRHFLLGKGAEALSQRDVEVLARAWTTQFRYRDEARRARDVRQLRPLAESFIGLLEAQEGRVGPY